MAETLTHAIGCTRLVYNLALAQRQMFGRRGGRFDPSAELVALKRKFPLIATDAFSQRLQQALHDLDAAYKAFFEGRAGYPVVLLTQGVATNATNMASLGPIGLALIRCRDATGWGPAGIMEPADVEIGLDVMAFVISALASGADIR